ncbi:hepatocyte growth factor-regulated tyrosine kinase substrate isoform 3-T3 [Polymixia lowei]
MGKGGGTFERLLDKATSQLLLETDWESILQICDLIRQGDTQAKYAIGAIKKKLNDKNPHVALYALEVLESVVKNCGQTVHDEVASKQTMEELKDLIKQTEPNVRNKILYLIQAWAHAFRNEPKYKVVQDTYQIMKVEGHVFPEFKESDAMFAAERAPDWVDAEECHRCRVQFGVMTRKHHCRACGQIFCGKCSSKYSTIPKFGIEKEVRVCEPCFELLNNHPSLSPPPRKAEGKAPSAGPAELPPEYLTSPLSQQSQVVVQETMPPKRDEAALQEEEELQLAIALSQSEAEEKERMRQKNSYSVYPKAEPTPVTSSAPPVSTLYSSPVNSSAPSAEDVDPELARYLNRTYWEKKQEEARKSPTPSAPAPVPLAEPLPPIAQPAESHVPVQPINIVEQQYQNGESEENHEQFLKALQNAVTTFLNRMKSNHMRGRSITNDSAVLSLFQSINNMHPQLLDILNQLDEKRLYYEGLQDKLAQVRDARAALNALRDEHREKLRRAAEEAERQRQIQLAQKLEIMRQKKQEYLEMQRQLAIQRLQEQEKERQMRLEQQKHTIQMRAQMPAFSLPYAQMQSLPPNVAGGVVYQPGAPPSYPGTFSPAGSVEGSPMHNVYMNQPGQTAPGQYQAMPVSATDPNMVNAYMYQTAGTNGQPAPPGQAPPTTSPPYSNYQPTPTQGYQQNVVSQAQSMPPMSQAPPTNGMGYMGYQPYNMQNMMSALPGQDPNMPPQQPYMAGQQPMYQQMAPPGGPQQQQQQQQQQQVPQAVPGSAEAQLISFD